MPEVAFWLLLAGEVPTAEATKAFTKELHSRAGIPPNMLTLLSTVPKETHPMTQLSICMLALQKDAKFDAGYKAEMQKPQYWEVALEEACDLIRKIPVVAAHIYHRTYKAGILPKCDIELVCTGAPTS